MRFFVLFFFFTSTIYCQNNLQESEQSNAELFEKYMGLENPDTLAIDNTLRLADNYYDINLDTASLLIEKCVEWTKTGNDRLLYCRILMTQAQILMQKGEVSTCESVLQEAKVLANATGYNKGLADINSLTGNIAIGRGEFADAITYYLETAKYFESVGDKEALAKIYLNIGGVFFDTNQLDKYQEYNNKISDLANELDNDNLRVNAGGNTAICLMTQGIHYYLDNQMDTANIMVTIDTLNSYFQRSERKYDQTLELARKVNNKESILSILNNMVALANNMEKADRAEKLALEAEEIAKELGAHRLQVQSLINLTSVNRRQQKYTKALEYGKKAVSVAKEYNLERKIALANMRLYDLYYEMGLFKEALELSDEIRTYELKTNNAETSKAIAEIETKYQTAEKEKEILQLESNNEKIKSQRNYLLGGSLILGLLGFFGIRLNRLRNERNDKKAFSEALMGAQEEERKKIARDLHDGIGQSLLLIKKQMEKSNETTTTNQKMISETLEEVRSLSRDLHLFQLDKFGLTATVEEMIEKVKSNTNLFITQEIVNIDEVIPKTSAIHVFRTIQEALSNVIKHAEASAAKVTFNIDENNTIITIRDNGKGFDPELTIAKSKSLGLKTMHERISTIGGKFKVEKGDPNGTVVSMQLPKKPTS